MGEVSGYFHTRNFWFRIRIKTVLTAVRLFAHISKPLSIKSDQNTPTYDEAVLNS